MRSEPDPKVSIAGTIGNFQYFPAEEGPMRYKTEIQVPFNEIIDNYSIYKTLYTTFDTAATAFNTAAAAYTEAVNRDKSRSDGGFSSLFQSPVLIPTYPCAPTTPVAFTGPKMMWNTLTNEPTA